jgi:hypothetical protein
MTAWNPGGADDPSDDEWLLRDEQGGWGSDDGHLSMIGHVPGVAALILWKVDGGRERWMRRAESYDHELGFAIRERVAELDGMFATLGV